MNFPNLPGARLRGDAPTVADPFDDAAEVERRLTALGERDLVPVRSEWLEATIAKAVAARPTVRRSGPFRRLLAAAVAMFGVHGMLAAATVATVGVVVAAVVWTAERNSNETMSYAMALEILRRADQPEEHRVAAMTQVVARIRATITVLREVRDDPSSPAELVAACRAALDGLRAGSRVAGPVRDPGIDPLDQLADLSAGSLGLAERLAVAPRCAMAAEVGWSTLAAAPSGSASFDQGRVTLLRRLNRLLGG